MADVPTAGRRATRACATDDHRPPSSPSRRAAARRADLDHGRRRGRDAAHHAGRRSTERARPVQVAMPPPQPSADRVRDYQDRLRMLEAQALRDAQAPEPCARSAAPRRVRRPPSGQDPIAEDRRRREYESLFASNVVLSRRPDSERPDQGRPPTTPGTESTQTGLDQSVDR